MGFERWLQQAESVAAQQSLRWPFNEAQSIAGLQCRQINVFAGGARQRDQWGGVELAIGGQIDGDMVSAYKLGAVRNNSGSAQCGSSLGRSGKCASPLAQIASQRFFIESWS